MGTVQTVRKYFPELAAPEPFFVHDESTPEALAIALVASEIERDILTHFDDLEEAMLAVAEAASEILGRPIPIFENGDLLQQVARSLLAQGLDDAL